MNETILVVPNSMFTPSKYMQEFSMLALDSALSRSTFRERSIMENCDFVDMLQVIPYTIIKYGDSVLRYCRSSKSGEKKLENMYSIGIGGHVDFHHIFKYSESNNKIDIVNLQYSAMQEIREEIGFENYGLSLTYVGFIYCTNSDVNRRHLGLVGIYDISNQLEWGLDCLCIEDHLISVGLIPISELVDGKQYEDWSCMIIRDYFKQGKDNA